MNKTSLRTTLFLLVLFRAGTNYAFDCQPPLQILAQINSSISHDYLVDIAANINMSAPDTGAPTTNTLSATLYLMEKYKNIHPQILSDAILHTYCMRLLSTQLPELEKARYWNEFGRILYYAKEQRNNQQSANPLIVEAMNNVENETKTTNSPRYELGGPNSSVTLVPPADKAIIGLPPSSPSLPLPPHSPWPSTITGLDPLPAPAPAPAPAPPSIPLPLPVPIGLPAPASASASASAPTPTPVSVPVTTPVAEDVDSALAKLPRGSAAIIAPKEVLQYQGFDVTLRLAHKDLDMLLNDTKEIAPTGVTIKGISGVQMSERMEAELVGADFIIEGNEPVSQIVTLREDTVWTWRVRSEMPGLHTLTAKLHTIILINGKDAPRIIEVAKAQIPVIVNTSGWSQRHWDWIATGIVLPILGWFFKRRFSDKK